MDHFKEFVESSSIIPFILQAGTKVHFNWTRIAEAMIIGGFVLGGLYATLNKDIEMINFRLAKMEAMQEQTSSTVTAIQIEQARKK